VQETLRRQRGIHTDIRPMASQIRVGLLFWIYDSGLTALALDQQLPRVHEPAEMFVPLAGSQDTPSTFSHRPEGSRPGVIFIVIQTHLSPVVSGSFIKYCFFGA
jgi:hypothetical protein